MAVTQIYLSARLDAAAQTRLEGIYKTLTDQGFCGTQTPDLPYHLTMGSFDPEERDRIMRHTAQVCAAMPPVEISFSHIGLFGLSVLFLTPVPSGNLLRLHERLIACAPTLDIHPWTPHATILMDEPERIMAALPIVAQAFTPFTATVDRIDAFEFFPAAPLASFPLNARDTTSPL